MYKKHITLSVVFLLFLQLPTTTNTIEHKVKAAFIEKFTRFIEWPAYDEKIFIIGVVGDTAITTYLYKLSQKRRIKGKKVIVKVLKDFNQINRCQVIFVSNQSKDRVSSIVNRTRNRPILTISDSRGSARKGILINFYLHKSYVRFEINDLAVKKSKLKFSSKLLKLAKIVR